MVFLSLKSLRFFGARSRCCRASMVSMVFLTAAAVRAEEAPGLVGGHGTAPHGRAAQSVRVNLRQPGDVAHDDGITALGIQKLVLAQHLSDVLLGKIATAGL